MSGKAIRRRFARSKTRNERTGPLVGAGRRAMRLCFCVAAVWIALASTPDAAARPERVHGDDGGTSAGRQAEPTQPPNVPRDWDDRDFEGRWVAMERCLTEAPEHGRTWVAWLAQAHQFELLEWLCLAHPNGGQTWGGLEALIAADAPQAMRCAEWVERMHRTTHGSLTPEAAMSVDRGKRLDWYERFATNSEKIAARRDALRAEGATRGDGSAYSPPLTEAEVFGAMSRAGAAKELGEALRGRPGAVYVHQVIRAIGALALASKADQIWHDRLRVLTKHADWRIRQAALQAYTRMPPSQIPASIGLEQIDDASERPEVRQAAVLAQSCRAHPSAEAMLLRVASEAEHPAAVAALSRLGDLPSGPAMRVLRAAVDRAASASEARTVAEGALQKMEALRCCESCFSYNVVRRWCRLVGWLEETGSPEAQAAMEEVAAWCRGAPAQGAPLVGNLRRVMERSVAEGDGETVRLNAATRRVAERLLAELSPTS
jgi:hypothetical protein